MLLADLVKEYLLIGYLKFLPKIKEAKFLNWSIGTKGSVILIPGLHESTFFLFSVGDFLNKQGFRIYTIPDFKSAEPVSDISKKLEGLVERLPQSDIILISHSKGGLVAKYFLDTSVFTEKVKLSISIATPYGGTIFGHLHFHNLYEVRPKSPLLTFLGSNKVSCAKIVNFYPKFDNHVLPNSGLLLAGAQNIQINVSGHTRILNSNQLLKWLADILL